MRYQDSTRIETAMTTRVEVLRKQRFARSNGVGRVGNDDVEATVGFGYKLQSIINDQLNSRIIKGASGVVWKVLPA